MNTQRQVYVIVLVIFIIVVVYMSKETPENTANLSNGKLNTPSPLTDHISERGHSRDKTESDAKTPLSVWSHSLSGIWNRDTKTCRTLEPGKVTTLVSPFGNMKIHVHDPKKDIWVSKRIINTGSFDLDKISTIAKFLEADSSLNFIDIGANLGTYTLSFAKLGRKVISIDALNLNVKKLCASVSESHFEDRIYMVLNAMSSRHETVSLAADEKNFGGTFIDQNADYIKKVKGGTVSGRHYNNVTTIVFDDLLTLPYISLFPRVFIKMDIEGFEHKALEKAHQFFKNIYVKGIQIEWIFHQNKLSGQSIINFLQQYSFRPYNPKTLKQFPRKKMGNWATQDVLWLRQ